MNKQVLFLVESKETSAMSVKVSSVSSWMKLMN